MKSGDIVTIYEDPITQLKKEGTCKLLKPITERKINHINGAKFYSQRWQVEFVDDEFKATRVVWVKL